MSFQFVQYPNPLDDIVVVGYVSRFTRSFTIKPKQAGLFRLLVWPQTLPEIQNVSTCLMEFPRSTGPPVWITFSPLESLLDSCQVWSWCIVETSQNTSVEEIISSQGSTHSIASGVLRFPIGEITQCRTIVWSCHQPYTTKRPKQASVEPSWEVNSQLYSELCNDFSPDLIWGMGDTAYADGTPSVNLTAQFEKCSGWQNVESNKQLLKEMYRQMYRFHWSFPPMQKVMRKFPHLLEWDDHEIRDGWGSHYSDSKPESQSLFECAQEVAQEFVLNVGPRVRVPEFHSNEAFYSYFLGPQASFVFDSRSSRRYQKTQGVVVSPAQWQAFQAFICKAINDTHIKYLLIGSTVPLFHLRAGLVNSVDYWQRWMPKLGELQDDIRDSWSSPGNQEALRTLLEELKEVQQARPDLVTVILAGDIHVGNAFVFRPPGFSNPIFQVTTSALSNRHHLAKSIALFLTRGKKSNSKVFGKITRIWPECYDPNVLCVSADPEKISFHLKIFHSGAIETKLLTISPGSKWESQ